MSIQTAIENAQQRVADCYTAISNKGGTLPATQNLANMPTAIGSIPSGSTINNQDKTVTLNGSYTADAGYTGLGTVTVNVDTVNNTSLSITPSTSSQSFTPSDPYTGYSTVSVAAVTSAIDSDIQAGNIKSGVNILGVTGTYSGSASTKYGATVDNFLGNVNANGLLQMPSQVDLVFTGVKNVAANVFQYEFATNKTVKSISFPDLESLTNSRSLYYMFGQTSAYYNINILESVSFGKLKTVSGKYTLQGAFYGQNRITTIDISKLETVSGSYGCSSMFNSCERITTIDLSGLKTVSGSNGCDSMFYGCTGVTSLDISGLETISGSNGCSQMFFVNNNYPNSLTSVTFTNLSTISSSYALQKAFQNRENLQSVSFPALTSSSFGSYTNQFNNMLGGITGCTVHFPSSIQSTIGSWSDVTAGFGGTNTVILFDL